MDSRAVALSLVLVLAAGGCELVAGTKTRKVGTLVTWGSGGSSAGGTVGLDAGPGTGGIIGTDGPPAIGDRPLGGEAAQGIWASRYYVPGTRFD